MNVELVGEDELWYGQFGRLVVVPTEVPIRTHAGRLGQSDRYGRMNEPQSNCSERPDFHDGWLQWTDPRTEAHPESCLKLRLCSLCQVSTAIATHPFCAPDLWLATLCLKVLIGVFFPFRRNHPSLFLPPVYLFDSTSSPPPFIRDLQHLRLSCLCVLKRDPILLLKRQVHMPTYQNSGP
ncbi:hypothetical protein F2Q70_00014480 [Brassica cretica]|nr:hypothetical protein F2Q70_00014480 [Brassica cretica]